MATAEHFARENIERQTPLGDSSGSPVALALTSESLEPGA